MITNNNFTEREILFYRSDREYGFLSNLYRCPVMFEGRTFRSSEDAYQFGKPRKPAVAEWLISAPAPHLCAAAAHSLFAFDIVPGWSKIKVIRMRQVVEAKFRQNKDLYEMLMDTGTASLKENSPTDPFWGIGKNGDGKNMLGVILMDLREKLLAEECF
jgi:ribA/ribD-fused uncharacterized protein